MPSLGKRLSANLATCLAPLLLILPAGCDKSSSAKVVPVTGKVMLGKTPLAVGMVTYHPDASKGNTATETSTGTLNSDGTYKLMTGNREGATAGWYKVTVSPFAMPKEMPQSGQAMPKAPHFDVRYHKVESTPISIEVVANPAAEAYYIDLK